MKLKKFILISALCSTVWFCKSPFDTDTSSDNLFTVTAEFDQNKRITDTLMVKLSWDEITIENFKEIKISRFNEHRDFLTFLVGAAVNGWITFATIANPFTTSWVDIVTDDAVFQYRLRYYNNDDYFLQTNTSVTIRPTTHVFVPLEFDSIGAALDSYIIDEGDTIFKCMSEFDNVSDTSYNYKVDYKKDSIEIIIIEVQCE